MMLLLLLGSSRPRVDSGRFFSELSVEDSPGLLCVQGAMLQDNIGSLGSHQWHKF